MGKKKGTIKMMTKGHLLEHYMDNGKKIWISTLDGKIYRGKITGIGKDMIKLECDQEDKIFHKTTNIVIEHICTVEEYESDNSNKQ